MKDREHGNEGCRDPQRWTRTEGDDQSEGQRRKPNDLLRIRNFYSRDAEDAAERHHQREGDGEDPDGGAAELRAPEADRDHGHEMIGAGQGMQEAGLEAQNLIGTGMSEGGAYQ